MNIVIQIYRLLTPTERWRAFGLIPLTLISVVLETVSIGLIIPALTLMTQDRASERYSDLLYWLPSAARQATPETLVAWGMVLMVLLYAIKTAYSIFLSWIQTTFAYAVQVRLSRQLMTSYLSQPYTFHLKRNSAQLIHNATTGINLSASAILHTLTVATEGLVALALVGMLLVIEPLGTISVVGLLGIAGVLLYGRSRKWLTSWGAHYHRHEGLRIQQIQQALGGIKEVLLLGRAGSFINRYEAHGTAAARVAKYQSVLQNLPRLALEAFAVAALACLVFILLAQGHDLAAVVTTLGLFATAAFRLIPSANRMLSSLQWLVYQDAAISTLAVDMKPIAPAYGSRNAGTLNGNWQAITFDHVHFRYDDASREALADVSLNIPRGQAIGLIGASGSGKTTTIDLLLGLLEPTSGGVTLDGQDIREDIRGWQNSIGYVPQTIFLTDESLRQNVAFGIPDEAIDDAAVERALKAAQLYDFALQLPQGLETEVGERGARLSGGQRQRIGIARALYHDPQLLVLDEATSALDTETEQAVMEAIQQLRGEKTIVLIAHRMSTVSQCDRLYHLSGGRVVAEGRPDQIHSLGQV